MTSKAWRKERSFPCSLTFHPRRRRLAALSPEPAALTACPRVYRLGRPRARRGSRLTSAARVSSARAPVRSSVRSAVERDKQWQRHSARNADDLRSTALRAGTYLPPGTESSNPPSSSRESWVAGLATLPVTYCFSLCSWCDRMACSGVGSPSGSEASMLSLVGSDRRLSNKCPSERKCHHARLPLECASESRQSTRPARYETKTRDISA
jgi:hypothetical protein